MTTKASKPVTPAKVRTVLRKAGHVAAKSHATRIRGFRDWSAGWQVSTHSNGTICVDYRHGSFDSMKGERRCGNLSRYYDALIAAGIACEIDFDHIVVTPEATPNAH